MQCYTDDVIGQIYDVTDPWPDTHIWLVYLPWTHKGQKNPSNRIHHLKKRLYSQIMWFEVNVRLSEVTDLKWHHGTEWQCGNSTLAMSWPKHVQILSFASMASRQGAVKHGFVSKLAGGCSSYDVIAPWPDLTWSTFLYQKLRKVFPIRNLKTRWRYAPPFFSLSAKNLRGGGAPNPLSGRGLMPSTKLVYFQAEARYIQGD